MAWDEVKTTKTMADAVVMDGAGLKENVNPVSGLWGQPKRERKLGLGGLGVSEVRSRERLGVLAPNPTLGNSGGVEALEWLKDRMRQHKLVYNSQTELGAGSRHLHKHSSPVVDSKLGGAAGKSTAGLSSKELSGNLAGREHPSFVTHPSPGHSKATAFLSRNSVDKQERIVKDHRISSSGALVVGNRSRRPANLGVIEIYQDSPVDSQDQRDESRNGVKVKQLEITPAAAAAGSTMSRGLSSRAEIEQHSKVRQNSPTKVEAAAESQPQLQYEVNRKTPSSRSPGSGAWSETNTEGTPYKRTVYHQHRNSADPSERSGSRDRQLISTGRHGVEPRPQSPAKARTQEMNRPSPVTSPDPRDVSSRREVEAEEVGIIPSPGAANAGFRRLSARPSQIDQNGTQISATTLALLSRIQQHEATKLFPRKSPDSIGDVGSSIAKRQGTPYKCRSRPSEQEEAARSSRTDRLSQCDGEFDLRGEKDGGDGSVVVGPKFSPLFPVRNVGHLAADRQKNDYAPKTIALGVNNSRHVDFHSQERNDRGSLGGNNSRNAGCLSQDRATSGKPFAERGRTPPPAEIRSDPIVKKAGLGSSKWSRSSIGQSQAGARFSSSSEDVPGDDVSKWNPSNMDITAGGHRSALLTTEMTGASSSGSSSTPCLMGNTSADEDTVKSQDSVRAIPTTPSLTGDSFVEEDAVKSRDNLLHPISSAEDALSYRLSSLQKMSRTKKRFRSLGPASRVVRVEGVESCNSRAGSVSVAPVVEIDCSARAVKSCDSRISPVFVAPVIEKDLSAVTGEEAGKNEGQLEYPWLDPKKRKAERDPTSGYGDTSQIISALDSAEEKLIEGVAALAQQHNAGGPNGIGSIATDYPSHLVGKEGGGARLQLQNNQVSGPTKLQPRIPTRDKFAAPQKSASSWPTTINARTVAPAGGSTPPKDRNHNGVSQAPTNSGSTSYRNREVSGSQGILVRVRPDRAAAGSALSAPLIRKLGSQAQQSPLAEAGEESPGRSEELGLLATEPTDLRELAVDMTQDNFLSREKKENEPIPVVPNITNGLSSLSLEGNDILKADQSKLPFQNRAYNSPIPLVSPLGRLTTSAVSLEHVDAPLSTSHLVISVPSIEKDSHDPVHSPSPSQQQQRKEAPVRLIRSSPFLSDRPRAEQSNKAVGLPSTERRVEVSALPLDRAPDSEASVQQSSLVTAKENGMGGASATSQKKMSENSQFVWVNGKRYQKLGRIGKGGSSEVYKVIDSDCNIYALKKINLKGREHSVALGFYQEIEYLERLLGKRNVVQLIACEVTDKTVLTEDYEEEKISEDVCIYMVLEFGEIDLAGILSKKRKQMLESSEIIDDNWLRFYWKHMLLAVKTIHDERIVHADLKPANFLLVKGELKLIDFGIAKAIQNDTTHIVRDSQVGTLNYMSPEAFMTNSVDEEGRVVKCGRASDIWSLGCILYQMVYGHTPFSQVDSFYAKIQAITSKNYKIEFPPVPDPWLIDAMKKCLTWDRYSRPHITDLLQHPFLCPELACQQKLGVW